MTNYFCLNSATFDGNIHFMYTVPTGVFVGITAGLSMLVVTLHNFYFW